MRLAGTLADQHDAATLVDYLFTQGIASKAERSGDAWQVWIFDEDHLERGRAELSAFQASRDDPRYREAAKQAEKLRREKLDRELAGRRNVIQMPRTAMLSSQGRRPLTMTLLAASGVVLLLTESDPSWIGDFTITGFRSLGGGMIEFARDLPEVRHGQWWRLVSPILLHFDFIHFALNMLCLVDFGTQIEMRRGSLTTALLVLAFAVPGNLGQFWLEGSPMFGGMSGVLFGMFGYIWMKSRFEPWSGFVIHPAAVFLLLVWFVLGLVGYGQVRMANVCHGAGLAAGLVIGYAPTLLRNLRGRG